MGRINLFSRDGKRQCHRDGAYLHHIASTGIVGIFAQGNRLPHTFTLPER
jgi:hypothetical protein